MFEIFAMGKYGPYVWSSYGITIVVLVLGFVIPVMQHKKLKKVLARRIRARRMRE
jgi:heme exporter protein D